VLFEGCLTLIQGQVDFFVAVLFNFNMLWNFPFDLSGFLDEIFAW
jgi:hypothetical protein